MSDKAYQAAELKRHEADMARREGYFANVADFVRGMGTVDNGWIREQTEWMVNGSYGAGACLAFQRCVAGITPRMNRAAVIGQFILSNLYGKTWKSGDWHKLDKRTLAEVNKAVKWFDGRKRQHWAMELEA
jgi:hypothetical protein